MVKRVIVGAHYGTGSWLAQRVTAVIMALYTIIAVPLVLSGPALTYEAWKGLFAQGWVRIATLLFAASLAWHAWVGMRDILMDYIKPTGLRLTAQFVVAFMLLFYLVWTAAILWGR